MAVSSRVRIPTALLAAALAASCAPTASSERDETIPVPRGATWAWSVPDTTRRFERDAELASEITHQRFVRAIETTMAAKGFRKVDSTEQADFLLSYHIGVARPMGGGGRSAVAIGVGYGGRYGRGPSWGRWYDGWGWGFYGPPMWGPPLYSGYGPYPAGAYSAPRIAVVLRQRSSNQVAWEGRYVMDVYDRRRVSQQRVQAIVDKLLHELP